MRERKRLDRLLVERGLIATRSRARDLIARGLVTVAGRVVDKPGAEAPVAAEIAIAGGVVAHVSRGAEKLIAALDAFRFDPAGRIALDLGASTGGFTQILLERGAPRVYAVDVGHGQLAAALKTDPRVRSLEGTDARALDRRLIPEPIGAIVGDVSFISLAKALPAALELAAAGAWLVALVKPQFEAGRAAIGKRGIVRDGALRERALAGVAAWLGERAGWRVVGSLPSPIAGGSGNIEYLLGARRDG